MNALKNTTYCLTKERTNESVVTSRKFLKGQIEKYISIEKNNTIKPFFIKIIHYFSFIFKYK